MQIARTGIFTAGEMLGLHGVRYGEKITTSWLGWPNWMTLTSYTEKQQKFQEKVMLNGYIPKEAMKQILRPWLRRLGYRMSVGMGYYLYSVGFDVGERRALITPIKQAMGKAYSSLALKIKEWRAPPLDLEAQS